MERLYFASDYMEGCHPRILERLAETNLDHSAGYGMDEFSESARARIREACGAPEAEIFFLAGGTQTNALLIDAALRPYEGVLAAESGHISVHEAGAIEYGGHQVMRLPQKNGKITAADLEKRVAAYWQDENRDHMVMPGMVYLSQPTEFGTLYSLSEMEEISRVCRARNLRLYVDGARLAYALACPGNDVGLTDLARLCDAFYIGGTKCGALFGEALVIPRPGWLPHLFTMIKQHGALLAKGRIPGLQFDTLFRDGLYASLGKSALQAADRIRGALMEKGYTTCYGSPTNQIFVLLEEERAKELYAQAEMSFWERVDESHAIHRIATSWATTDADVDQLIRLL